MKKQQLLWMCLAALLLFTGHARAQMFITVSPNAVYEGSATVNTYHSSPTITYTVTVWGPDMSVSGNTYVINSQEDASGYGGVNLIPAGAISPASQYVTSGSGSYSYTVSVYAFNYPNVVGYFSIPIKVYKVSDPSVFTTFSIQGTALPPVGVDDYIALTSVPTPISPTSGAATGCPYSFCPATYTANFYDYGTPTTVTSWSWSIKLYHTQGMYTLPGTTQVSGPTYSDNNIYSAFTLPSYDWIRDANNDIMALVDVIGYDSDGFSHRASQLIGIKSPPDKPRIAITQVCPDLHLMYNAGGATSYKIYYSTVPGPPYNGTGITQGSSPISAGTGTTYTLTGLTIGTPYYITVKGVNALGESVDYADPIVYTPMNCNDNITGCVNPPNLVTNGDFSSGNTGFTSALTYASGCVSNAYYVGTQLTSKCSSWSPVNFNDHTSGTGNFLIIDGNPSAAANVWSQNVTVNANTTYTFSFWARNIYSQPFNVEMLVNGTTLGTTASIEYGNWTKYSTTWYSGNTFGSVPIALRQQSGGAYRDFGIDDIYFGHCSDLVHGCVSPISLATNGNFSSGNTGFTSSLPYSATCTSSTYAVGTQLTSKCSTWSSINFTDHTSGTGNFLIVDGNASSPCNVWSQNVSVNYNTSYTFSFWARSLYTEAFSLEFLVNGNTVAATPAITYGSWTEYSCTWFSGMTNGSIPIAIRQQTGGLYRDFGLDDIYFGYCGSGRRMAQEGIDGGTSELVIAPNPNNGTFIVSTGTDEAKDISVYDITGQLVFSQNEVRANDVTIDLSDQPKGIYLVRVVSGNSVRTQRVICQ